MSRLGKTPISLPKGVEIKKLEEMVQVKGSKGSLSVPIAKEIGIRVEGDCVAVTVEENGNFPNAMYGLYRVLIANAIQGVSHGFEKRLSLVGVGYRAAVKGNILDLQLGYSHSCELEIPEELQVKIEKNTLITISGIDKQLVGQFAANVRAIRPPEPYKGKGVRYHLPEEQVRKKAGKTAKGK